MKEKNIASKYDLFVTMVVTIIGSGVFAYSRLLTESVGTDGWIVSIISGALVFLIILLINLVIEKNNYSSFNDILENNLGKFIGKLIVLEFVAYNIVFISSQMRTFIEVTKMYLLERTPTEFILMTLILCGTYLVRGEVESLIRFNEIAFWLMFLPMCIIIPFAISKADFSNLLPVFTSKPKDYILGIKNTVFTFGGFSILFMLLPILKNKAAAKKTEFYSILFITIFYVLTFILAVAFFSKYEVNNLLWPSITLVKCIEIPGTFVERWEGIVMTLWVIFNFTTFVNIYYFSTDILTKSFKFEDIKITAVIIAPFIYLVSLFPENISSIYELQSGVLPMVDAVNCIVLPIILLLITAIRRRYINEN